MCKSYVSETIMLALQDVCRNVAINKYQGKFAIFLVKHVTKQQITMFDV